MHWDDERESISDLRFEISEDEEEKDEEEKRRFTESLFSPRRMNWDHEPQRIEDEDENEDTDDFERFMESLLSFLKHALGP